MTDFFLKPDWPAPANVRALVSTRAFGNLADHVGDEKSAVATRRAALRAHLPAEPLWLTQVHGTRCVDAVASPAGIEADASWAGSPRAVCAVLTADCLPILFCDAAGTKVAAAHAGWRGLAAGVVEATVAAMAVAPERLIAWLGPAIGPSAFEVGDEVRDIFIGRDPAAESAFVARQPGKWWCDLYALARLRLARLGVSAIFGGQHCTCSETELFYSYRRERETGRMASLVWLI
jgi:YfiH family protein